MYSNVVSHWNNPGSVAIGSEKLSAFPPGDEGLASLPSIAHQMLLLDALSYLPDDILVKLDRASMAVGLEARVPFLDHRVVEYAWKIPIRDKIRARTGKWALRQILRRYIPAQLTDRPKSGFGIPLGDWLRGPLREWAESLLDEKRLKNEGLFEPGPIREKWAEHLSGKAPWEHRLRDVLMFQAWFSTQRQSEREMAIPILCRSMNMDASQMSPESGLVRVVYVVTSSLSVRLMTGQLDYLRRMGFEVVLVSSPGEELQRSERDGVRTVAVSMAREISPWKDLVSLWRLVGVIWRLRPTIVNFSTPKAAILAGIAARLGASSGPYLHVAGASGLRPRRD